MKTNQENQIRLIDDKTIAIIARKSIHGTPEIIIDSDEWEKVKCLSWNVVLHNKKLYVRAHAKKSLGVKTSFVFIHRIIMGAKNRVVDHINGNPMDNRKCNLRIVEPYQNSLNREWPASAAGHKGVTNVKSGYSKTYQARISIKGKRISLGYFDSPKEAAIAYNNAALKLHGEFARLNNV